MRFGYYILLDKIPVPEYDTIVWGMWFETADRTVLKTQVDTGEEVSTVFLGLDHNFFFSGPPILFETLIFGGIHNNKMWRYSTWEQAETGHNRIVEAIMGGDDPDDLEF